MSSEPPLEEPKSKTIHLWRWPAPALRRRSILTWCCPSFSCPLRSSAVLPSPKTSMRTTVQWKTPHSRAPPASKHSAKISCFDPVLWEAWKHYNLSPDVPISKVTLNVTNPAADQLLSHCYGTPGSWTQPRLCDWEQSLAVKGRAGGYHAMERAPCPRTPASPARDRNLHRVQNSASEHSLLTILRDTRPEVPKPNFKKCPNPKPFKIQEFELTWQNLYSEYLIIWQSDRCFVQTASY